MRLENQGLSLWYCTPDAPGPEGVVPAGAEMPVTVGLSPLDASNQIDVHYRVNAGAIDKVSAGWFRNDQAGDAQYFTARLPAFVAGDEVEWWVTAHCCGRYVPAPGNSGTGVVSLRVVSPGAGASARSGSGPTSMPKSSMLKRKGRAMADAPSENAAPLVRLDPADAGNAPTLSYNVPDPTSYPGRSYITLNFGENDPFRTDAVVTSDGSVVVPVRAMPPPGRSVRQAAGLAAEYEGTHGNEVVFGPAHVLSGDAPTWVREVVNASVIRFDPGPRVTPVAVMTTPPMDGGVGAPVPAAATAAQPQKVANGGKEPNGGGPEDPHDPPSPKAVVRLDSPPEGATFDAGPNGFDLSVQVRVTFNNRTIHTTAGLPAAVTLTVNGTDVNAARAADPVPDVRRYAASPKVLPGTVTISARVLFAGQVFTTMAARTIEVRAATGSGKDATPPSITVDAPAEGINLTLGSSGALTVEVRGRVSDPESMLSACTVALDGGTAFTVAVGSDGAFSHQLTVTEAGDHEIVVRATNAAGLSSQLTRRIGIAYGALIPRHRLMLVECLRLSNYLGRYGAGRIVQTFSLLPGEKTSITIRSFESIATAATETSSIFDSFSETTGDELTSAVTNEDTSKSQSEDQLKASVNVKAGATWGFGSASVEAGLAYGTSSAREQLTKNVTNGASRHAAEKSSKRDIKVDTTRTVTSKTENETTIMRTLENTNLSRTLNFVFRQMTQEFVSLLHLADMRVAHMTEWFQLDGKRVPGRVDYEEVALPQLHSLLLRICASEEHAASAEAIILRQLDAVFDYRGDRKQIADEVSREIPSRDPITGRIRTEPDPTDPTKTRQVMEKVTWTRFDPDLRGTWPPLDPSKPEPPFTITVPGVILGVTENTLRTDGIVVDAFLGGGPALDTYSSRLQLAAAGERQATADLADQRAKAVAAALGLVADGDDKRADVYAKVFPPDGQEPS